MRYVNFDSINYSPFLLKYQLLIFLLFLFACDPKHSSARRIDKLDKNTSIVTVETPRANTSFQACETSEQLGLVSISLREVINYI